MSNYFNQRRGLGYDSPFGPLPGEDGPVVNYEDFSGVYGAPPPLPSPGPAPVWGGVPYIYPDNGSTSASSSTPAASGIIHTVQKGETLSGIAARYRVTWQSIAALNKLANPNLILVGQRLAIPAGAVAPTHTTTGATPTTLTASANTGANNNTTTPPPSDDDARKKKAKEQQQLLLLLGGAAFVLVVVLAKD